MSREKELLNPESRVEAAEDPRWSGCSRRCGYEPSRGSVMQKRAQVVVITGASAGVGRATARAFAQRGASIALLARDGERLEAARREVEDAGGRALVLPTDVAH